MSAGAIYIITQDSRYVGLLLNSAASLKRVMPDLPVTVFSQFPIESALFERIIRVEGSRDGFYDKTLLLRRSPYERTLFLDADTYLVDPVPELFTILDHFDCAATHEEYINTDWWNHYLRPDIPASFPEFNTGVLAFNRLEWTGFWRNGRSFIVCSWKRALSGKLTINPFFVSHSMRAMHAWLRLPANTTASFAGRDI
jgi:hypothetical protein